MNFDPLTAYFIVGVLYLCTPLITWGVVADKCASTTIWWCTGGMLTGIGTLWATIAADKLPWMTFQVVTSVLLLGGMLLKMRTLPQFLGKAHPHGFISAFYALYFLGEGLLLTVWGEAVLRKAIVLSHVLLYSYLAWLAWQLLVGRKQGAALWILLGYVLIPPLLILSLITQTPTTPSTVLVGSWVIIIPVIGALMSVMNHIGYVGLLLETSQRDAVNALAEAAKQTERQAITETMLVSQRERLLANISRKLTHELSQPLTSLLSTVRLLRRAEADGRLDNSAEVAAQIVDQIRPMAKGHGNVKTEINLQALVEQALDLLKVTQESTRFHFATVRDPAALWVNVNQVEMIQVFINLFSNALQATDMAGLSPVVTISLYAEDGQACCVIEDNGLGFSEAALSKVGQNIFTTKSDGMGVGLWLCQEIMQRHDGSLSFANYEGGARVEVRLPLVIGRNTLEVKHG